MTLADRIVIFDKGRIQQVGTPGDVFKAPANVFVAAFIGTPTMNLLQARLVQRELRGEGFALAAPEWLPQTAAADGRALTVGFRPQALRMSAQGALRLRVAVCEYLGTESQLVGTLGDSGLRLTATVPGDAHSLLHSELAFDVPPDQLHVFDAADGQALRP